nr:MAG TPA: PcfJ like protein [Caudoviricetes sp.]
MRRKLVEQTPPPKCRKKGWWTIVQDIEGITVLNIFSDGGLKTRHCIDITHKDYATLHPSGEWSRRKIEWSYDIETQWMYNYCDSRNFKNFRASSADVAFLRERFPKRSHSYYDDSTVFAVISKTEYEWAAGRRENTEIRRCAKVQETMSRIPPLPEDVEKWFYDAALGEDFAIRTDAAGVYMCTACHGKAPLDAWRMPDGKPARNNDMVACPHCGSSIRLKRRRKDVFAYSDFIIVQPIDDTMSVIKVCNGRILIMGDRKDVSVREKIRILSGRGENAVDRKNIYYQQYGGDFDNKSNPHNHRISSRQYMYPVGITEALSGTKAGMWSALFTDFAAAGLKLAYGTLITCFDPDVHALMEMLYRGRFYKLLAEESGRINDMEVYIGCLNSNGTDIESTFGLGDRQLINRLRDRNGGGLMLAWLQWSERNRTKLSDKVLAWLKVNELWPDNMTWIKCRFSPEQAMNYIERQRREQYKKQNIRSVINQYEDYMDMCARLKKDTSDEMIYRPRELKRRHDEAVEEIKLREAELKAEEYSERYPEAEKVLGEIADKLAYRNDRYIIVVPKKNIEIVHEGRELRHCAGSSDRYFDRIAQRETYICFLRKAEEPDKPYYTIEVEPGGTIRQHRGMYDEEPEIEEVKPFLREWQREIRKRMSHEDHELAAASRQKREENIRELKEKNNTRVLEGLMEDFMEAAGY